MKQVCLSGFFLFALLFYSVIEAANAELQLVLDINETGDESRISRFTQFNGKLFFTTNNSELWKSDGTSDGTTKLFDSLKSGFSFDRFGELPVLEDGVYFIDDLNRVRKTGESTLSIPIVYTPNSNSTVPSIYNGGLVDSGQRIFFFEDRFTRSVMGFYRSELRTIESDLLGSQVVKNFDNYNYLPYALTDFNNRLVFTGSLPFFDGEEDSLSDFEPYISDGTASGTFLIKDIFTNSGDMEGQGSNPSHYTVVGNMLFFIGQIRSQNSIGSRLALFKSDGTEAGTSDFFSLNGRSVTKMFNFNGSLVLIINSSEIWISDGTNEGTEFIKNISTSTSIGPTFISSVPESVSNESSFYFFTSDKKMWVSDGSRSGTNPVADFTRSSTGISPVKLDGMIYFVNRDERGSSIWSSDGTIENTKEVVTNENLSINTLTVFDNKIYVSASSETVNNGLYVVEKDTAEEVSQGFCFPVRASVSKFAVICL